MKKTSLLLCVIIILTSCGGGDRTIPPDAGTDNSVSTTSTTLGTPSTTPAPKDKVGDLEILDLKLVKNATCSWKYEYVATFRNNGPDEIVFNATANWKCPGGRITSAFSTLANGGYLGAGQTREYTNCSSTQLCDPTPGLLDITCTIEVNKQGYKDSNTSNNKRNFRLAVPF